MSSDPMGLIGELNRYSDHPRRGPAPQESYMLVPLRWPARCTGCGAIKQVTLVLGLDEVAICAECDPASVTAAVINGVAEIEDGLAA